MASVSRVHPLQVFVPADFTGLVADVRAQAEQVRAVVVERLRPGPVAALPGKLLPQLGSRRRRGHFRGGYHLTRTR